jgi:CheY-like chemotaxis protein
MGYSKDIRILIVEDDPVQAQVLQDKLHEQNADYVLVWFKTGEELLDFLGKNYHSNRLYYLILDYFLQTTEKQDALNGAEIIKQLAQGYPKIRTILFSAYENDEETKFESLKESQNVINFVKKGEFAYNRLQNIMRFDFNQRLLSRKKRRLRLVFQLFVAVVVLSLFYFISTVYFF